MEDRRRLGCGGRLPSARDELAGGSGRGATGATAEGAGGKTRGSGSGKVESCLGAWPAAPVGGGRGAGGGSCVCAAASTAAIGTTFDALFLEDALHAP